MPLCGLTGGIGAGKTVASGLMAGLGWAVIDTDQIARQVVAPGSSGLEEIVGAFGPGILDEKGALDRKKLAGWVFGDAGKRMQLEAMLHPKIRAEWKRQVRELMQHGVPGREGQPKVLVVIPLLFETGAENEFDEVICVGCSRQTQLERLLKRGWDHGQITQRIGAQWNMSQKMDKAGYVIWNEFSLEICKEQAERILRVISRGKPAHLGRN